MRDRTQDVSHVFSDAGANGSVAQQRWDILYQPTMDESLKVSTSPRDSRTSCLTRSSDLQVFVDTSGLHPMAFNIEGDAIEDDESLRHAVEDLARARRPRNVSRLTSRPITSLSHRVSLSSRLFLS